MEGNSPVKNKDEQILLSLEDPPTSKGLSIRERIDKGWINMTYPEAAGGYGLLLLGLAHLKRKGVTPRTIYNMATNRPPYDVDLYFTTAPVPIPKKAP